jgi:hypothetical protein
VKASVKDILQERLHGFVMQVWKYAYDRTIQEQVHCCRSDELPGLSNLDWILTSFIALSAAKALYLCSAGM